MYTYNHLERKHSYSSLCRCSSHHMTHETTLAPHSTSLVLLGIVYFLVMEWGLKLFL